MIRVNRTKKVHSYIQNQAVNDAAKWDTNQIFERARDSKSPFKFVFE